MTTTTDHGERLARLEGAYEHLATKADISKLELRLTWRLIVASTILQGLGVGTILYFISSGVM